MAGDASSGAVGRGTLFLSYARADRAKAEKLAEVLRGAGHEVWWDALIEGGARFERSIFDALARADAVVVLWSRASVGSDWVRDEAGTGRDRRRLVPLSLDGVEPPLGFRQYHTLDLSGWTGRRESPEMAAVLHAVASALADETQAARATPQPAPRPSRRGALALGASALGVATVAGIGWAAWRAASRGAGGRGVAVLPFRNLSADPAQAYFADGLTEEVRSGLRRLANVKVVAAVSSEAASRSRDDAPTMARRLGVAWLLGGSVQRAGDAVRIAVDLTDGATGFSRWSNSFDRPMADIFALESDVAATVAAAMSVAVGSAAPAPGGTADVAAYEHFLRGRTLFNLAKDEASDRAALAEFEQAVALDPAFAGAHAARSRALAAIAGEYATDRMRALFDQAILAAHRAVDLAPGLAQAQLALGYALFTGRLAFAGARPFYDRALALGAGDADIVLLCALYGSRAGRPREAQAAIARALQLDPLNPRTWRAAGSIAYAARRFPDAAAPLRRALALNPATSNAHALIGDCLLQTGQPVAAAAEFAAEPHAAFRLAGLAIARRRLGDGAGAQAALAELRSAQGANGLYQQAQVLAQWGDVAAAVRALEQARAAGDSGLIYLATDPLLDPVRSTPQVRGMIRQMNAA